MSTILCIDAEPAATASLDQTLSGMGHRAVLASSLEEGLRAARQESIDLIISDLRMPSVNGCDLLSALRDVGQDVPVIMTSSYHSVEQAVESIRHGAVDYLTKPLRTEAIRLAVRNAIELHRMRRMNGDYERELKQLRGTHQIVGRSPALRAVMEVVRNVAPTSATVLLQGESGTGKELVARALHQWSPRASQPFVTVNCAALPEGLVESSLFGHERGAFTGATSRASGAFERAHRGTLLLDEVSEMRLDLQSKLLRAIQEQEFERVGGHETVHVDVRLVATTNRDLYAEVKAGRFRSDLYFRLHVVPVHLPPLRERLEDIPEIADHLVRKIAERLGMRAPQLSESALGELLRRRWTGNIRELGNALERALILCRGREITAPLLSEVGTGSWPADPLPPVVENSRSANVPTEEPFLDLAELEHLAILRALERTGGNRTRAAALLGICDRTLRNKLRAR
jgi:DNA-binding NtrC family response regulator